MVYTVVVSYGTTGADEKQTKPFASCCLGSKITRVDMCAILKIVYGLYCWIYTHNRFSRATTCTPRSRSAKHQWLEWLVPWRQLSILPCCPNQIKPTECCFEISYKADLRMARRPCSCVADVTGSKPMIIYYRTLWSRARLDVAWGMMHAATWPISANPSSTSWLKSFSIFTSSSGWFAPNEGNHASLLASDEAIMFGLAERQCRASGRCHCVGLFVGLFFSCFVCSTSTFIFFVLVQSHFEQGA